MTCRKKTTTAMTTDIKKTVRVWKPCMDMAKIKIYRKNGQHMQ